MEQIQQRNPWWWIPTLYIGEGLPNVVVMTVAVVMYMQLGMSDTDIALYTGWLGLPWVVKPLWSPFVDLYKTKRWWVLTMQMLLASSLAGVAFTLNTPVWFVGIRNTFYRLAVIFGNGVLIPVAGMLQLVFRNQKAFTWSLVFYGLAALFLAIWLYHAYIMPRSKADQRHGTNAREVATGIMTAFRTFFQKLPPREMLFAMLFLLFYRFPEALLGKMSVTFLMRPHSSGGLGLSPQEFGLASGTIGVIGLTLGGILGGLLAGRDGFKRWLWPMVCAITLPDIVYVYMSYALPDNLILISSCIFIEQFGYGLGFTALTLYMLYFAKGSFQTSHYAFCTAISYLGLMLPGMVSGWMKDMLGYRTFFIIVMFLCLITFAVTAFIKVDPEFGKKNVE